MSLRGNNSRMRSRDGKSGAPPGSPSYGGPIGLVFGGGGGKGAYQVGALRALRGAGIQFEAFSGTSIGAFNATLAASLNDETMAEVWRRLSLSKVARISRLIWSVPFQFLLMVAGQGNPKLPLPKLRLIRRLAVQRLVSAGMLLAAVCLFSGLSVTQWQQLGWALVAGTLIPIGALLMERVADRLNPALLSHRGLLKMIRESINWEQLRSRGVPVLVTVGRKATKLDLHAIDVIDEARLQGLPQEQIEGLRETAESDGTFRFIVPDYVRIDTLGRAEAANWILASMALPFGLFCAVRVRGKSFVDGGMVDNVPIYPLAVLGCRTVFVLHTNPISDTYREKDTAWTRLLCTEFARAKAGYRRPIEEGLVKLPEIIDIAPRKRLGWPIVETLVFGQRKSAELDRLGYEDACAALARASRTVPVQDG